MDAEGRGSGGANGYPENVPKRTPRRSQVPSPSHGLNETVNAGDSTSYVPTVSNEDGSNRRVVRGTSGSTPLPPERVNIGIPSRSLLRMISTEPIVDIGSARNDDSGSGALFVDPVSTGTPTRTRRSSTTGRRSSGGKSINLSSSINSMRSASSTASQRFRRLPAFGLPFPGQLAHSADVPSPQILHRTPGLFPRLHDGNSAFSMYADKVHDGCMSSPSRLHLNRNSPLPVLSSVSAPGGYFSVHRSESTQGNRDQNNGGSFNVPLAMQSDESSTTGASSGTMSTMTPSSEESLVIEYPPNADARSHVIHHSMAPGVRRSIGNIPSRERTPRGTPRNHAGEAGQFPQQLQSPYQRETGTQDSLGNIYFRHGQSTASSYGLNGQYLTDASARQSTGGASGGSFADGGPAGHTVGSSIIHRELVETLGDELRNVHSVSEIGGIGCLNEPSGILSHRSADEGFASPHGGSGISQIRQDNIEQYIAAGNFWGNESHLIAATHDNGLLHQTTTPTARHSGGKERGSASRRSRISHTEEMGDGLIVKRSDEGEHAVDDEEEGSIFLIPDNFNVYAAPFGDTAGSSSGVKLDDDVQMYTARGQDTEDNEDDQPCAGSETLNFTFSYSDVPAAAQSHEGSNSSGSVGYEEDALFYNVPGGLSYHAGLNIQGHPGVLAPTAPMNLEDLLYNHAFYSGEQDMGSCDEPADGMTFSDRVQLFVARRASEHGPDGSTPADSQLPSSNEIELDEDYIKAQMSMMTSIEQGSAEDGTGGSVSAPPNLGTPENNDLQTMPVLTALQESVVRQEISEMGTLMPLITENEQMELIRSQHPLSPPRSTEDLMHTDDAINKLYSVIPASYSQMAVAATVTESTPEGEMVVENAVTVPDPSHNAHLELAAPLQTTDFYSALVREKSRLHSDIVPSYDERFIPGVAYGLRNIPKRLKLADMSPHGFNDESAQKGQDNPVVMPEAELLVDEAYKRVQILVGAKLCESGYSIPADSNDRPADVTGPPAASGMNAPSSTLLDLTPQKREVQEEAKQMLSEVMSKLKSINAAKEKMHQSCVSATNHATLLANATEVYSSVVKECRQLTKSIQQRQKYSEMQTNLIGFKSKHLETLRTRVAKLTQRVQLREANGQKLQHMEHLIETLRNIYAATGIRVVPLDAGSKKIRWVFAIFFNADCNTKRCIRSFRKSWHNDLVRVADNLMDGTMNKPVVYRRIKAEQRFNPEINMLVCIKVTEGGAGYGNFLPICMRSVLRCGDESSPEVEATRTPHHRTHVPVFRSDEWPSCSPILSKTPSVTRELGRFYSSGVESTNSATSDPDALETEDAPIEFPRGTSHITICPVKWDDMVDVSRGLRIVFTAPKFKTGGGSDKVWEQVLTRLLEAANKRMRQIISRWMSNNVDESHPVTLIALMREVMDYGSALSARIRVVQRELLQLLKSTCAATFTTKGGVMTVEVVFLPQAPKSPSLLCSVDVDAYDLLQKGSYTRAARNIRLRAMQHGYDLLLHYIHAAMAAGDRDLSIYDFVADACQRAGHMLYKHAN
ncbi:hypothetical protein, conserved [Babesia bigemina]|uniref:Uncharacterized protein n=1 Tax=Babesia bigemina TaxID=5866 RepID=A0A061DET2_BABBI|nr:hypothetical protein, conserved [Babesia bigemina]CDR97825.1 hypothetical protein, conserved [Babesia bigemina]|eukprot:XP_012770011.1 hypothetical protein, conserved [Babesia bigemina]